MVVVDAKYRAWTLREFRCCGNLWQVLLSPRFPERKAWRPECQGETTT